MIKSYLKSAFRSLARNRQATTINILGLAVGMSACLLMAGYVFHELSFESVHVRRDRIFRVNGFVRSGGGGIYNAMVVSPLGPAAKDAVPEVEESVRMAVKLEPALTIDKGTFQEKKLYFTEPQAFDVFTLPLLRGRSEDVLAAPFSLVLDEILARKYFGTEDPVGRTVKVRLDRSYEFQVTGVMKAMPTNTVLHTRLLASFSTLEKLTGDQLARSLNDWRAFGLFYTFLRLRPGAAPNAVEAKIADVIKAPLGDEAANSAYSLQPLKDIYLQTNKSQLSNDFNYGGSPARILIFASIAFLILLLACINFVNLSLAKISQRLKGVGIRKTCGAGRRVLLAQFLTESLLLASTATAIGVCLFQIFKLPLDAFVGQELSLGLADNPALLLVLGGLVLVVSFLAGSYPGLVLARVPIHGILRSGGPRRSSRATARRLLVVLQFVIAISLIACTLGIVDQIRFAESRDLGFNKTGLLSLQAQEREDAPRMKVLQRELMAKPGIVEASLIAAVPAGPNRWMTTLKPADGAEGKEQMVQMVFGDARFVPAFGIRVVEGRNFEEGRGTDERAVLLNERAAKSFGLKNPVGSRLVMGDKTLEVIGVVRDFNTNSIHTPIYPVAVLPPLFNLSTLCVRLQPGQEGEAVGQVQAAWERIFPNRPFSYEYVEDIINRAYSGERKLASLLSFFCGFAVFIAALGIFGLSAFIGEQRTKEIGVRKVLGATVPQIVGLLAKSFARWAVAANIFALPLAYYAVGRWLRNFAYRTSINPWPFLAAASLALAVALLTVGVQALKAALANPVESLKYE
jgi:putative ABC transport system permease protein